MNIPFSIEMLERIGNDLILERQMLKKLSNEVWVSAAGRKYIWLATCSHVFIGNKGTFVFKLPFIFMAVIPGIIIISFKSVR